MLIFGINVLNGQVVTLPDELYGFRLGQYKSVVINELGQPSMSKILDDSSSVDFYPLPDDSSTYVMFQYLKSKPKEIYAIQLSGIKSDRAFYGIQLGDNEQQIISEFGNPDTIMNQEFNNTLEKLVKYTSQNLSFLLNNDKIESIRIWDQEKSKNYDQPTLNDLLSVIETNNRQKICDILSPNLEIYYCDKVITWNNSFYKDTFIKKASVYDFIVNSEYGLIRLKDKKELNQEYNIRFIEGVGTFPVFKFPKDSIISEIVLNFQQGRYKIYEIKYKCQQD